MKTSPIFRSLCAVSLLSTPLLAASGCGGNKASTGTTTGASAANGEVVAHIGDQVVTVDEFKAKVKEQPPMALARLSSLQGKKDLLNQIAKFDLLAAEAKRQGLDKSPQVQETIKRILVQELVNQFFQAKIEPTDADLSAYYTKHQMEFEKPEQRRVQQIFLAAPQGAAPEMRAARAKAKEKAERLLAKIKDADVDVATATDPSATLEPLPLFSKLAKEDSNDARTRNLGGDTRYEPMNSFGLEYSMQFAKAVFSLTPANRLSGVIETPRGFHIARLLGVQAAITRKLDDPQVKNIVRDRWIAEQRRERFESFYNDLKNKTKIEVDDKVLASITIPGPRYPQAPYLGHTFPGMNGRPIPRPPVPPPPGAPGMRPGGFGMHRVPATGPRE